MIRNNRFFVSPRFCKLMLAVALLIQPLAGLAQNKTLNSGGANSSAAQNGASVDIIKVRTAGDDVVEVSWVVAVPAGVEVQGFEVRVDATLSNGTAQTDSKSFGGDARFGSFKFNLNKPAGGGPKPGGGPNGTIGTIVPTNKGVKTSDSGNNNIGNSSAQKEKSARKLGEGTISGGGNTGGNNNTRGNNNG
ncbi:MAG: hypothetical protein ACRD82_08450, partial [Blastocatellia bacterium]